MDYALVCTGCDASYPSGWAGQECGRCSSILEVVYRKSPRIDSDCSSFWDYEQAVPKGNYRKYSVGGTRLIESNERNLFLKMESENATGSFKDRGSVIEVGKAHEYGYREVVCASTGNMAYSITYYSKLYGIKAKVFISSDANKDKLRYIREVHDADVMRIDGDFTEAQRRAENYSKRTGAFLTGDYCYRKEGQKTVAYEVIDAMPDVTHLIVPVGNATLLSGVYKALDEMKLSGKLKRIPTVVAVQSKECMPLVKAFCNNKKIIYERPSTKADAIAVGFPTFGAQALEYLNKYRGMALSVSDSELLAEQRRFFSEYGLNVELAAVSGLAAYRKLKLGKGKLAVTIVTGKNV